MDMIMFLPAAAVAGVAGWVAALWWQSSRTSKQIEENLHRGRPGGIEPAKKAEPDQPSGLGAAVSRLFPEPIKRGLQANIDGAGRPKGYTVENLLLVKVAGVLVGAVGAQALLKLLPGVLGGLVAVALPVGFFFVADLLIRSRAIERRQQMARDLPELLDQMVIAVHAGLGFEAAMDYVARNSPGPLANEMGRAVRDIQTGSDRRSAYQAMAQRCRVDDVSRFVRAVNRASEHGIPISDVLQQQATAMRTARRQRAEAQAAKIPAKITLPVMLLIMPVLLSVVVAPAGIKLFHVLTGH